MKNMKMKSPSKKEKLLQKQNAVKEANWAFYSEYARICNDISKNRNPPHKIKTDGYGNFSDAGPDYEAVMTDEEKERLASLKVRADKTRKEYEAYRASDRRFRQED